MRGNSPRPRSRWQLASASGYCFDFGGLVRSRLLFNQSVPGNVEFISFRLSLFLSLIVHRYVIQNINCWIGLGLFFFNIAAAICLGTSSRKNWWFDFVLEDTWLGRFILVSKLVLLDGIDYHSFYTIYLIAVSPICSVSLETK